MPTLHYRLAICSEVFQTSLEDAIRAAARIGFDGIELAPFQAAATVDDVGRERREAIRKLAADCGIAIVGLHWLLVSPQGLHLTTADAATRERTGRYLRSLARFCADLGGAVMVLGSPRQRNLEPGTSPEEASARAAVVLREAAVACGDLGITLCLEPLHPRETSFLRSVEEALDLARAIDHPAVSYILDCKAMSGMPDGIEGTIRKHGRGAAHFHTNDPDGKGPGMGTLDFAPILDALARSGYSGWVSTEPFDYTPDAETVAATALRTLKDAVRDRIS